MRERKIPVKNVMVWTGAGQIGMAIARRMGYGMKIVVGDKKQENAQVIAKIMNDAGYDVVPMQMDLSSRASIRGLIGEAQRFGDITMMVNAAGVSPSQAPVEAILKVDLYGTAVLLEEVGKVIAPGGVGVTISSQSGHRMPALPPRAGCAAGLHPRRGTAEAAHAPAGAHPGYAARLPVGQTLQRKAGHGRVRQMGRQRGSYQLYFAGDYRNAAGH